MSKFTFRLQRVLEYRQLQEQWAKDAYLECVAKQLEAEQEIEAILRRRSDSLQSRPCAFDERQTLDSYVTRLEDEVRAAHVTRDILIEEVEVALQEWIKAKQDAEAMSKLRETELDAWNLDERRREQSELDEWSVMRRAS